MPENSHHTDTGTAILDDYIRGKPGLARAALGREADPAMEAFNDAMADTGVAKLVPKQLRTDADTDTGPPFDLPNKEDCDEPKERPIEDLTATEAVGRYNEKYFVVDLEGKARVGALVESKVIPGARVPRVVQPHIKRALEKRILHIEASNAARIWEIGKLEAEVDSLYRAYREEHFSLQQLRHALEFGGRR